jgi:hypothetical protein
MMHDLSVNPLQAACATLKRKAQEDLHAKIRRAMDVVESQKRRELAREAAYQAAREKMAREAEDSAARRAKARRARELDERIRDVVQELRASSLPG